MASVLVCGPGWPHQAAAADLSPSAILQDLHRSNQDGLELGRLAQRKGASLQARRFGDIVFYNRRSAERKVKALAKAHKITLAKVPPTGRTFPDGAAFNADFARVVIADCQKDLAAVTEAINSTTDKALQKLLKEHMAMMQRHIAIAKKVLATEHQYI